MLIEGPSGQFPITEHGVTVTADIFRRTPAQPGGEWPPQKAQAPIAALGPSHLAEL
jgi:hypothetical protein